MTAGAADPVRPAGRAVRHRTAGGPRAGPRRGAAAGRRTAAARCGTPASATSPARCGRATCWSSTPPRPSPPPSTARALAGRRSSRSSSTSRPRWTTAGGWSSCARRPTGRGAAPTRTAGERRPAARRRDADAARAARPRRTARRRRATAAAVAGGHRRPTWPGVLRRGRPADPLRLRATASGRSTAYQTVFAARPGGSAEMPSAGRPFTPELVTRLVARGVRRRAGAAAHRRLVAGEPTSRRCRSGTRCRPRPRPLVNGPRAPRRPGRRRRDDGDPRAGVRGATGRHASRAAPAGPTSCSARTARPAWSTASSPACTRPAPRTCCCSRPWRGRASSGGPTTPPWQRRYLWHEFGDTCLLLRR